jgi:aldehyde dehydrogenase (NAD+)
MVAEVRVPDGRPKENTRNQRAVQRMWSATPLASRLRVLRCIRHTLAEQAQRLVEAIPAELSRNEADTLAAEVLPLLEACKFLEREATHLLAARRLGRRGLPFWLADIEATVERVPLGVVLIIAPSNYPLFLPGVQALQALAAGNAVVWKPGRGGAAVAQLFVSACIRAKIPEHLLRVTDESVEAVAVEVKMQPDKIIFTGSALAGRAVQHLAAQAAIPVVAELSGCDAVIVLPSADRERVVDALCFGMRLNGSATCMAPRRLLLVGGGHEAMLGMLRRRFAAMDPIFVRQDIRRGLEALLLDARGHGATITGEVGDLSMKPLLLANGPPEMKIATSDLFAPVLMVTAVRNVDAIVEGESQSPFGLTASIFGDEVDALALGARLSVGTVLVNDLIVPTADPRVPFGGRRGSGFGVTRGAEGLLEMTAVKTTSIRRGKDRRHYQSTTDAHAELFSGVVAMSHRAGWKARFAGLKRLLAAAKRLK